MVSDILAFAGAMAFLLAFNLPMLYLAYRSYAGDEHSPAALREDADADAEAA